MPKFVLSLIVLLGTLAVPALADSNTDRPLGIIGTSVKLEQILRLHQLAVGDRAQSRITVTEKWLYVKGDLSGTQTLESSGDDYREDTQLGPFHTASGSYRNQVWAQNENGLTVSMTGMHQQDEANQSALRHALQPGSGVTLLGEVGEPQPSYLVKVAPSTGRVEYVFYDQKTYLIIRTERAVVDRRVVASYDDFRTTNGITRAWHVHETDGRPYNESDWKLQSLDYGSMVDPAVFQPPASDPSHFRLNAEKVLLPGKILADRIILTAQIGRHRVDFQLDSGASQILLDKSVADALGLPSFGKQTETAAGTYTATHTIVPRIEVGGAALENLAVTTAPFFQWADDSTPVAGLLGFDFIANCVVHIDYFRGEVDALAPASFQPPTGALAIPIRLDDNVPAFAVKIAATTSDRFVLDTGADRSALFSKFIAEHPTETADVGLGAQFIEAFPFLDEMHGVGGKFKVSRTQVPSLTIGSATFPRWLFSVVRDAPGFEGEDYDGLIGQDVLRNFDIYLDYPSSKIYLVPNDRYRQRWASS